MLYTLPYHAALRFSETSTTAALTSSSGLFSKGKLKAPRHHPATQLYSLRLCVPLVLHTPRYVVLRCVDDVAPRHRSTPYAIRPTAPRRVAVLGMHHDFVVQKLGLALPASGFVLRHPGEPLGHFSTLNRKP
jgi:hypothetical protein